MNTDSVWVIEEPLIDVYNLLVHRINGINLSLNDFWKMDTWILSKLYLTEQELIRQEEKDLKKGKSDPEEENSDEMTDLYEEMFTD